MFIHDIAVFSEKNDPVLLVEVKAHTKSDPGWASSLARFILSKTERRGDSAFLLATPEKWFFFPDVEKTPVEFDAKKLSNRFFSENLKGKTKVSHEFYERVVWDVLEEILMAQTPPTGFEALWKFLSPTSSGRMESQVPL